jgi:hypothetical protein
VVVGAGGGFLRRADVEGRAPLLQGLKQGLILVNKDHI